MFRSGRLCNAGQNAGNQKRHHKTEESHNSLPASDYSSPITTMSPHPTAGRLTRPNTIPTLSNMDVHLDNPNLEAKISQWVTETGHSADELVENALASYLSELADVRDMLD